MTLAEFALPPSQEVRGLWIAAASVAILAAVWIFQGMGYAPCELCLTQRYAFYAAIPLALLTALVAGRSAAWVGARWLRASGSGLRRQRGPRRLSRRGRTALVGRPHGLHRRPGIPRRQRPRESARFGQGRALRRSAAQDRRIVARRLECRRERSSRGLCGARRAALEPDAPASSRSGDASTPQTAIM